MNKHPVPLLIRADASHAIGIGHIMRCLAIIQSQIALGGRVAVAGIIDSNVASRIEETGAQLHQWSAETSPEEDLANIINLTRTTTPHSTVLIDGYSFSEDFLTALSVARVSTAVLDDYMHLSRYDVDILINPNPGAETLHYNTPPRTQLLLGSDYTPLRREFLFAAPKRQEVDCNPARRILITAGGSDPEGLTLKIARIIRLLNDSLHLRFVLGPAYRDTDRLKRLLTQVPCTVELLFNVQDMPSQMAWAQLAITAGGSTCHELACMGVPFIVCPVVENQQRLSAEYAHHGAAILLHPELNTFDQQFFEALTELISNPEQRRVMSLSGRRIVDGKGADRIVKSIHSKYHETTRGEHCV